MMLKQFRILALLLLLIPGTVLVLMQHVSTQDPGCIESESVILPSDAGFATDLPGTVKSWQRYECTGNAQNWRSHCRSHVQVQGIWLFNPLASIAVDVSLATQAGRLGQQSKDTADDGEPLLSSAWLVVGLIMILVLVIACAVLLCPWQRSPRDSRSRQARTPQDHGYDFKNLGAE
jgi:hypothetical protein